jgi:hypothetical protein
MPLHPLVNSDAKSSRGVTAALVCSKPRRSLPKVKQIRLMTVDAVLGLSTKMGLEGLSIGTVDEATQMSKSGVFAHISLRKELQISVVCEYYRSFNQEVFSPALQEPRGLPRLRALFGNWKKRVAEEIESGCIYISEAARFDDRPGAVHDALVSAVQTWCTTVLRAITLTQHCCHLQANAKAEQIALEIHKLILLPHHEAHFLKHSDSIGRANPGFNHILVRYATNPVTILVLTKE